MEGTHDYTGTLRLPRTAFPMRGLDSPGGRVSVDADLRGLQNHGFADPQDTYRTVRNGFRFMLGCLAWDDGKRPDGAEPLEAYMLSLLRDRAGPSGAAAFMDRDLRRFWLDARKDALYCDPLRSAGRLSALGFLAEAVPKLADMMATAAPCLALEVVEALPPRSRTRWTPEEADVPTFAWNAVRQVRRLADAALEDARQRKVVASSLDARLAVRAGTRWLRLLKRSGFEADRVLCVSEVSFETKPADGGPEVTVVPSTLPACARSFRRSADVGTDPAHPALSTRDAEAVRELAA